MGSVKDSLLVRVAVLLLVHVFVVTNCTGGAFGSSVSRTSEKAYAEKTADDSLQTMDMLSSENMLDIAADVREVVAVPLMGIVVAVADPTVDAEAAFEAARQAAVASVAGLDGDRGDAARAFLEAVTLETRGENLIVYVPGPEGLATRLLVRGEPDEVNLDGEVVSTVPTAGENVPVYLLYTSPQELADLFRNIPGMIAQDSQLCNQLGSVVLANPAASVADANTALQQAGIADRVTADATGYGHVVFLITLQDGTVFPLQVATPRMIAIQEGRFKWKAGPLTRKEAVFRNGWGLYGITEHAAWLDADTRSTLEGIRTEVIQRELSPVARQNLAARGIDVSAAQFALLEGRFPETAEDLAALQELDRRVKVASKAPAVRDGRGTHYRFDRVIEQVSAISRERNVRPIDSLQMMVPALTCYNENSKRLALHSSESVARDANRGRAEVLLGMLPRLLTVSLGKPDNFKALNTHLNYSQNVYRMLTGKNPLVPENAAAVAVLNRFMVALSSTDGWDTAEATAIATASTGGDLFNAYTNALAAIGSPKHQNKRLEDRVNGFGFTEDDFSVLDAILMENAARDVNVMEAREAFVGVCMAASVAGNQIVSQHRNAKKAARPDRLHRPRGWMEQLTLAWQKFKRRTDQRQLPPSEEQMGGWQVAPADLVDGTQGLLISRTTSMVDGLKGILEIAGLAIRDVVLRDKISFAEMAYRLWFDGYPAPTRQQLRDFEAEVLAGMSLPQSVLDYIENELPPDADPMHAIGAAFAVLAEDRAYKPTRVSVPRRPQADASGADWEQYRENLETAYATQVKQAARIVGAYWATLAAVRVAQENAQREEDLIPVLDRGILQPGWRPHPDLSLEENFVLGLGWPEDQIWIRTPKKGKKGKLNPRFRQAAVCVSWVTKVMIDHGLNGSTFTEMLLASLQDLEAPDLVRLAIAELFALNGPWHGGANIAVAAMLNRIFRERETFHVAPDDPRLNTLDNEALPELEEQMVRLTAAVRGEVPVGQYNRRIYRQRVAGITVALDVDAIQEVMGIDVDMDRVVARAEELAVPDIIAQAEADGGKTKGVAFTVEQALEIQGTQRLPGMASADAIVHALIEELVRARLPDVAPQDAPVVAEMVGTLHQMGAVAREAQVDLKQAVRDAMVVRAHTRALRLAEIVLSGLGHAVYKERDPRAHEAIRPALYRALDWMVGRVARLKRRVEKDEMSAIIPSSRRAEDRRRRLEFFGQMEGRMGEVLHTLEYYEEIAIDRLAAEGLPTLKTNVDLYSGGLYVYLNTLLRDAGAASLPLGFYTAMFMMARIPGGYAHAFLTLWRQHFSPHLKNRPYHPDAARTAMAEEVRDPAVAQAAAAKLQQLLLGGIPVDLEGLDVVLDALHVSEQAEMAIQRGVEMAL